MIMKIETQLKTGEPKKRFLSAEHSSSQRPKLMLIKTRNLALYCKKKLEELEKEHGKFSQYEIDVCVKHPTH